MADEIKIKAPSVEQNININVSGEEEIRRLGLQLQAATSEADRLSMVIEDLESELSEVKSEFENFQFGRGIDIMREELDTLRRTISQSESEFRSFLQSVNLNDDFGSNDRQFSHLFEQIRDGSITASQAVMQVKTQFAHLMEENYSKNGGLFDSQMVQNFTAALERMDSTLTEVERRLNSIEQNGVKSFGGDGGGGSVVSALEKIEESARGMSDELKDSYTSITELVKAMNEYANLDDTKLLGVSQAFKNIAAIGQGSYGTKSIENIIHLTTQLQALSGSGAQIRFDFTGLNDLNVKKASMNNLATFLPEIAKVNVGKLEQLSKVDLSNFNNIKVSKGSIENIARLTEAVQALKDVNSISVKSGNGSINVDSVASMTDKQIGSAMSKIERLRAQIDATLKSGDGASDTSGATGTLGNLGSQLDDLMSKLKNASITNKEFTETFNILKASAVGAMESIKAESKDVNKILVQGSAEYGSAQTELSRKITQTKETLYEFSAAENSNNNVSRNAFVAIKEQLSVLDGLSTKLESGSLTRKEFSDAVKTSSGIIEKNKQAIVENGDAHKTAGEKIKNTITRFSQWFSVGRVVIAAYNSFKKMVKAVVEVDTAMTELRKVTDETEAVYSRFMQNAASRSKNLGTSLADTITATADFARLGYNIEDAERLSDAAVIYKNVGDGIENISDASSSIISTMKAFGVETKDAMFIVDKFNEVGNNFAISSKGVGDALLRSASAAHVAGNSLDETIGLITAANTVVQNPDSVGTAMKTVSMYLRAAKTEAEEAGESTEGMAESVSKLREEILALTGGKVDIQIDENTFKSTYQIIGDLSRVWSELTDISKANILEKIGGKRNGNVVTAMIENFNIAESAMESAANAAGSATTENEKFLDSIQGRINILKAAFQALSTDFINSDTAKFVIDLGTKLIGVVDSFAKFGQSIGGLKTLLAGVASAIAITNAEMVVLKSNMIITSAVAKLSSAFSVLRNTLTNIPNIIKDAVLAIQLLRSGTISASSAVADVMVPAIGLAVAAFTIITGAITAYNRSLDERAKKEIEAGNAAIEDSNNIASLALKYNELSNAVKSDSGKKEELLSVENELINALGEERSNIVKNTDANKTYAQSILEVANAKLQDSDIQNDMAAAINGYKRELENAVGASKTFGNNMNRFRFAWDSKDTDDNIKALNIIKNLGYDIEEIYSGSHMRGTTSLTGASLNIDGDLTSIEGVRSAYERLGKILTAVRDAGASQSEVYSTLYDEYNEVGKALGNYDNAIADYNDTQAKSLLINSMIGKEIPNTKEKFDEYRDSLIAAANSSGKFAGSGSDIVSSIDAVLSTQAQFVGFYDSVGNAAESAALIGSNSISALNDSVKSLGEEFENVQKILSSQKSGISISAEDLNTDGLEDYASALEYVNGAMQLNADKVSEIVKAKAEEKKATIETEKALAQSQYLENARQIEKYRKQLIDSSKDNSAASEQIRNNARTSIEMLLEQNSAIADSCTQYDLLSASLLEASGAYQHWLNAQSASDYGDMANDAVSAIKNIRDTFDSSSDIYGNFGSKKFEAAVDFIIPDTVDSEDLAAVEQYMSEFGEYLTYDDKGAAKGLNVDKFLSDAVNAGLMSYSEDDGFKILGGKKMEDFAEGLNLSSGVVQAFFDTLQLKGGKFDWGDEIVKSVGDLAVNAYEAAENLRQLEENSNLKIKIDISDLETTEKQVSALDETIAEMQGIKARPEIDVSDIENANTIIQYCVVQKQLLTQPDVMRVDTSMVEGDISNAISLLQEFKNAQNDLEALASIGADTTEAQAKVDELAEKISTIDANTKIKLGLDTTSVDAISTTIESITPEVMVSLGVDAEAITGYDPETKECKVIYDPDEDLLPKSFDEMHVDVIYDPDESKLPNRFTTLTRYVNYVATGATGGGFVDGTAHGNRHIYGNANVSGTAMASGDWGTAIGGRTLVGELG